MSQKYGWTKKSYDGNIFWFKGYILDATVDSVIKSASLCLSRLGKNRDSLSSFISSIRGHFSFIIYNGNALIAVVDKVATIPLFYAEDSSNIVIGSNATAVKDIAPEGNFSLDMSSILEISMSGYTVGNKTLYKQMKQIVAGEYIYVCNGCIHKQYYHTYSPWKVNAISNVSLKSELTNVLTDVMDKLASSIKGKDIIVPLSAGYDSRAVVSGLKHVGVENILCVSYGRKDSFEVLAAKNIASRLGYDFKHIDYNGSYIRRQNSSYKYNKFKNDFDRHSSVEFVQDMPFISLMHKTNELSNNSVIINGMSGDYISGSHILRAFSKFAHNANYPRDYDDKMFNIAIMEYLDKHYNLWGFLSDNNNKNKIIYNLLELLKDRNLNYKNIDNMHSVFEFFEFYGRQSKFVLKGQEVYDYYGCDWRLPLWDPVFVDFWQKVPIDYKYSQKLYKDVLVENNWGGVWDNIPLNEKTIRPKWIKPIRLASKILLSPLGRKKWHQFEKNFLEYWMDDSYNSKRYPYSRYVFDYKEHKNVISFRVEDYIQNHTDIGIDTLTI